MKRINVICHMLMSLDGKINGDDLFSCKSMPYFEERYYTLAKTELNARVQLVGRNSTDGFIDCVPASKLPHVAPYAIPRTDHYADLPTTPNVQDGHSYFAVLDPHGRLAMAHSTINSDMIPALKGQRLVSVLVEDWVSDAVLAQLRTANVPYVFAGKDALDVPLVAKKLVGMLGGDTVVLYGGARINATFLTHKCLTQLSIIQAPVVTTNPEPLTVMTRFPTDPFVNATFTMKQVQQLDHSGLWLRYDVEEVVPSGSQPRSQ